MEYFNKYYLSETDSNEVIDMSNLCKLIRHCVVCVSMCLYVDYALLKEHLTYYQRRQLIIINGITLNACMTVCVCRLNYALLKEDLTYTTKGANLILLTV